MPATSSSSSALAADRQLDLPLVAILTQLRHNLLAGIEHPTAADHMLADSAVIAYRNMLRVQGWLGSLCLQIERDLFGQSALTGADAPEVEAMMERLENILLPMLERCQRMLCRVLDRLETRQRKGGASISIAVTGQVNVDGAEFCPTGCQSCDHGPTDDRTGTTALRIIAWRSGVEHACLVA
jgi:hypothetical protein